MLRKTNKEYDVKRTRQRRVQLRLTEDEYKKLKDRADKCSLSINAYIINTSVNGQTPVMRDSKLSHNLKAMGILKQKVFTEWQRQGNNLNQISKKLNSDAYSGFAYNGLKKEFQQLRKELEEIKKWLQ